MSDQKKLMYIGSILDPKLGQELVIQFEKDTNMRFTCFGSLARSYQYLTNTTATLLDFISVDYEIFDKKTSEVIVTLKTLCQQFNQSSVRVGAVIGDDTSPDLLRSIVLNEDIDFITLRFGGSVTYTDLITEIHKVDQLDFLPSEKVKKLLNRAQIKNKCPYGLTNRQQEILLLIKSRGLSNKQVARILNLSESSIKSQLTQIFRKVGVRSRGQLQAIYTKV